MPEESQLDRIERKVNRIGDWIYGTDERNPGANIRLDRIEQREKSRSWLARTSMGAAIAALLAWGWSFLTRGGSS